MFSQNGWAAGATKAAARIINARVGDVTFPGGFRDGDAAVVLLHVATQIHLRVEAGIPGWCWGWNFRSVRGAKSLSNHASGTAFDWNAPRHPLAKANTWSPAQQAELRKIKAEVDHVIRYGFEYAGRKDDMHVELNASPAKVAAVANRLRAAQAIGQAPAIRVTPPAEVAIVGGAGADGLLRPGAKGADVLSWQRELWRIGYGVGLHDAVFGPAVEGATLDLQRAANIGSDGIVGNITRDTSRRIATYPKPEGPHLPLCQTDDAGATIGAFQQRLKDRGWDITVDNKYGAQTAMVVRKFQTDVTRRGFNVGPIDGIGGPLCWTALWIAPVT